VETPDFYKGDLNTEEKRVPKKQVFRGRTGDLPKTSKLLGGKKKKTVYTLQWDKKG